MCIRDRSYSWSITGGPTLVAGDTSAVVNFTTATLSSATITVNTQNACGLGSPTRLTVLVNLGCRESGSDDRSIESLSLFPNPSHGLVELSLSSEIDANVIVEIMDMPGQVLSSVQQHLSKGINLMNLDLSNFAKGIYFVNIRHESGKVDTSKLILE